MVSSQLYGNTDVKMVSSCMMTDVKMVSSQLYGNTDVKMVSSYMATDVKMVASCMATQMLRW